MRKPNILLLVLLAFYCSVASGQNTPSNHQEFLSTESFTTKKAAFSTALSQDVYYLHLQFNQLPNRDILNKLAQQHIKLLSYQAENTYLAAVPENIQQAQLDALGVQFIALPKAGKNLSEDLKFHETPAWASVDENTITIAIKFHAFSSDGVINQVLNRFAVVENMPRRDNGTLIIGEIDFNQVKALAAEPTVAIIDFIQEPDQMLNFENRQLLKVTAVQSSAPGALNLEGTGVTVGVGDGGELGKHIDFGSTRVTNYAAGTYSSFGAHGDHVSGIIAGAGLLDPRHKGIAPKAGLITQKTSLITYYTEDYFNNHRMVLTNNSYGTTSNCDINGAYNYTSQSLDWQSREFPKVLHLYAAGNSGGGTCPDYPQGYRTVLRYYQAAKNVLTVGNVKDNRALSATSSKGPVQDGRLKPEVCGIGHGVQSTGNDYNYWRSSGTSMATPTVAGVLALMIERYRQLHADEDPDAALMKALVCNTAEDMGRSGPDYQFGFGLANALRGVRAIENNQFSDGEVADGENNVSTINVPAGVSQVKVMLYWADKEADPLSENGMLVNDLDLQVVAPGNGRYLPWVLNPEPANVADDATRGFDRLNNIEQVTINTPEAGEYKLIVDGYEVPFGPQKYVITYDFVYDGVEVTAPYGGEVLEPGVDFRVQWDAPESNISTFKVEWSSNGGDSWSVLEDNIESRFRYYVWKVPAEFTEEALVRVTRNGTGHESECFSTFSIIETPKNLAVISRCENQLEVTWSPVAGIEQYEVLMLVGNDYQTLTTTTDSSYVVEDGLDTGENYWFTVRSLTENLKSGIRAIAVVGVPEPDSDCDRAMDGAVDMGINNFRGRHNTNRSLGSEEVVTVTIENKGVNTISSMDVYYQLNDETPVKETYSIGLAAGVSLDFDFAQTVDLSMPGTYTFNAWIEVDGDTYSENDEIDEPVVAVQLENDLSALPYRSQFNQLEQGSILSDIIGPDGLEEWDIDLNDNGYAVISEVDGDKLGLSIGNSDSGTGANSAVLNFNLDNYVNTREAVYFIFSHKINEKDFPSSNNSIPTGLEVFVRGSENNEWIHLIEVISSDDLDKISSIDLTREMAQEGQTYSNTTQLKFEQSGGQGISLKNISVSLANRLPVEMARFSVYKKGEEAVIEWTTETEENNEAFEIEIAEGAGDVLGKNFRIIGRIAGQGFSNNTKHYQFVDREKNKRGERYYRLKQVDFGGNATYSEFRVVKFSDVEAEVAFYPNPFMDNVNISYQTEKDQIVTMNVMDAAGKVVRKEVYELQKGRHEFSLELDEELPAGLYSVVLAFPNQKTQSYRISKVRD